LSIITNEQGGVIDDTILTNVGGGFIMTIHDRYEEHFKERMEAFKGDVGMSYFQHSILAVQGPGASDVVAKILPGGFDLENMEFMSNRETTLINGTEKCYITR
jgi:aminomethyltransferase